jgi:4-hydroxy-3-methylbut-2-enyl diphosphate reductase
MAEAQTAAEKRGTVYTMGPLIHNPRVLRSLEERGVSVLDESRLPPDLRGAVVIIRAHGITPALEAELLSRGARLADATCPKVKASQMKARSLAASSRVFLAGERRHGELIGIQGYAPDCIAVENSAEAGAAAEGLYRESPGAKTALLGQTTLTHDEYRAIEAGIRRYFPDLLTIDTICGATADRQDALGELCTRAEALIIAGGRESANTRRLLAIAEKRGKPAWLVEDAAELPRDLYRYGTVGLSAGASTPDELVDEIEAALLRG